MRRAITLPLALIALLTLAASVLAGGWATVAATGPTDGQAAGTKTIIDLDVLQHGMTAVSWPRLTVIATNVKTGDSIRTTATPTKGHVGKYTAGLTFPAEGTWTLSYDSPDLIMEGTKTLSVSAPVVPAAPTVPAAATGAAPASSATFDPAIAVGIGAAILILLVVLAAFVIRERRPDRPKQPTTVGG